MPAPTTRIASRHRTRMPLGLLSGLGMANETKGLQDFELFGREIARADRPRLDASDHSGTSG